MPVPKGKCGGSVFHCKIFHKSSHKSPTECVRQGDPECVRRDDPECARRDDPECVRPDDPECVRPDDPECVRPSPSFQNPEDGPDIPVFCNKACYVKYQCIYWGKTGKTESNIVLSQ